MGVRTKRKLMMENNLHYSVLVLLHSVSDLASPMLDSKPLSFPVYNSIFELTLPLIFFTYLLTIMPPKKTTTAKKGTQADG